MSLALALAARTPSPCAMMFSFETRSRADLPFRLVALRGRYEMSHFTHVGTNGRHGTVAVREAGGTPDETKPPPFTELGWRAFGHHITFSFALDTNHREHVHISLTQRHCLGESLPC